MSAQINILEAYKTASTLYLGFAWGKMKDFHFKCPSVNVTLCGWQQVDRQPARLTICHSVR